MEISIKISYNWSNEDDTEIKQSHREPLEEAAQKRITEMWAEGYTSGELIEYIKMDDQDPEDGVYYTGWWKLTTEVIE